MHGDDGFGPRRMIYERNLYAIALEEMSRRATGYPQFQQTLITTSLEAARSCLQSQTPQEIEAVVLRIANA